MRLLLIALTLTLAGCAKPVPETEVANSADAILPVDSTVANDAAVAPGNDADIDNAIAQTKASPADSWLGRWTGVEGMYLVVGKGAEPGRYKLEMQWDLDNKGSFDGVAGEVVATTIAFERNGVRETLRPSDGDATGLKYLAGKRDCLMIKPGEGYCRD